MYIRCSGIGAHSPCGQHTTTHCSALQHSMQHLMLRYRGTFLRWPTHCNTLQNTAVHIISWIARFLGLPLFTVQYYRMYIRCSGVGAHSSCGQHTATRCNTVQHAATLKAIFDAEIQGHISHVAIKLQHAATHCNTRQHTAVHINPHTATLCNILHRTAMHTATFDDEAYGHTPHMANTL